MNIHMRPVAVLFCIGNPTQHYMSHTCGGETYFTYYGQYRAPNTQTYSLRDHTTHPVGQRGAPGALRLSTRQMHMAYRSTLMHSI